MKTTRTFTVEQPPAFVGLSSCSQKMLAARCFQKTCFHLISKRRWGSPWLGPFGIHPIHQSSSGTSQAPRLSDEYIVLTLQALWLDAEKGDCRAHAGRCREQQAGEKGWPLKRREKVYLVLAELLFHDGAWKFVNTWWGTFLDVWEEMPPSLLSEVLVWGKSGRKQSFFKHIPMNWGGRVVVVLLLLLCLRTAPTLEIQPISLASCCV